MPLAVLTTHKCPEWARGHGLATSFVKFATMPGPVVCSFPAGLEFHLLFSFLFLLFTSIIFCTNILLRDNHVPCDTAQEFFLGQNK